MLSYRVTGRGSFEKSAFAPGFLFQRKFGARRKGSRMSFEGSSHVWGFSTAGRIFFGWGAASVLRNVAQEFGPRVLICTDQNMVKAGVCETVVVQLLEGKAEIKIFDEGQPEVDRQTIERL